MAIKLALPKGRLLAATASLLHQANWGLSGYHQSQRLYRLKCRRFPDLLAKVFHEKDIPVQVAVGNYDLGICGLDWVEELLVKYPNSSVVEVKRLGYGAGILYLAASRWAESATIAELSSTPDTLRIASEYPNLAESLAVKLRMRRFHIFPLWGATEVYPPESADLVLISVKTDAELLSLGLVPVSKVLDTVACLIANTNSWASKDLSAIVAAIEDSRVTNGKPPYPTMMTPAMTSQRPPSKPAEETIWLALPDGHQRPPALELLRKAGIVVDNNSGRRPKTDLAGVMVKVIRPQDMPLQVANGNFDLAITGRDWLLEHLYQFPSSPVTELADLKLGKVRIVAVVSRDLAADDLPGLREVSTAGSAPLRVASEYVNIADKYARDNHLGPYRVIPTWGASEAFIPEDADLLIENTQTGRTIARHNLKIIDTLFTSTACLISRADFPCHPTKGGRIKSIVDTLLAAVKD